MEPGFTLRDTFAIFDQIRLKKMFPLQSKK